MEKVMLVKAAITNTTLRGATLKEADCKRIYIKKSSLRIADLRNSDFSHALLVDVDLRGANVAGAVFYKTRIGPIQVYGMSGVPAKFHDWGIEEVNFSGAAER